MFPLVCHAYCKRLALGLVMWSAIAAAQNAPLTSLNEGKPASVRLEAKTAAAFAGQWQAGTYLGIQVRQTEGTVEATVTYPSGEASPSFISDGGVGSLIRIPLLPAVSGQYVLHLRARGQHAPAACEVSLLPVRPVRTGDEATSQAEFMLASAEQKRRQPSTADPRMADALTPRYDQILALARQTGDQALLQRTLIGKARYQIFHLGQYQQGLAAARQATTIVTTSEDTGQPALAWKTLASALAFVNHYDEATAAYAHALDLYRASGDLYWQGVVWGNLASIYRETGSTAKAVEAAKSALQLAHDLSDDYGVAFSQSTLGEIHQAAGEYQDALTAYNQALETSGRIDYAQVRGEVWTDLGELFTQLNDWEQARHAYETALPILVADGDSIHEIDVLGHLGELAWHAGEPLAARNYFTKGLERARKQKLVREETFLEVGLARLCTRLPCRRGSPSDPYQVLRRALAAARAIHQVDGAAAVLELQGDLLAAAGRPAEAMAAYTEAGSLWQQIPNKAELALVQSRMAALDMQAGRLVEACREIESGLDAVEAARAGIAAANLRTSYFSSKHGYYDLAVEILMRLESQHPGQGYAERAWTIAERARARTLGDALLRVERDGRSTSRNEIVSRSVVTRQLLDDHTVLLDYWMGDQHSYLWAFTASSMRSYTLPAGALLSHAVNDFQQSMLARDTSVAGEDLAQQQHRISLADQQLRDISLRLAHLLLPLKLAPAVDRMILVPDGNLLSLPFAALAWSGDRGAPQYLIQKYALVYEPSVSTAAALLSGIDTASGGGRIAIFADPVFSSADERVAAARVTPQGDAPAEPALRQASLTELDHLPRLPGSRREALGIAAIAGTEKTSLYLGFDASTSALEKIDWKSFSVVHFATHALVDTEHPEFSAIVLSTVQRDGSPASGVVGLRQIYRWDMPVSLVTLSGCQTARGHLIPGEGIDGLSRAFLLAGARSVMGTLWNAEDASAGDLIQQFYSHYLHDHLPAPAALRAAQLAMLSGSRSAPWFWAGFTLSGDWR